MKLTRNDIADALAERNILTREQSAQAVDAVFETISQALCTGELVTLHGFGRFSPQLKRAPRGSTPWGKTVVFRGFGRLMDRVNAGGTLDLDDVVWVAPPAERRGERRQESLQNGTAIVRVSGIPVCEFKLKSVSESGTSFWVWEDSFILRNIRVGQEIDIRIQPGPDAAGPALFRSRIAHITKAVPPEMSGHFILGVQILGKLPME